MAKFCTNCGKELKPGASSCTNCGAVITEQIHEESEFKLKSLIYACIVFIISIALFTYLFYPLFYDYKPSDASTYAFYSSLSMSFFFTIMVLCFSQFSKYSMILKVFVVSFWFFSLFLFLMLFFVLPHSDPFLSFFYSLGFGILLGAVAALVVAFIVWIEEYC